jgi:predicted transcriptional regulator
MAHKVRTFRLDETINDKINFLTKRYNLTRANIITLAIMSIYKDLTTAEVLQLTETARLFSSQQRKE